MAINPDVFSLVRHGIPFGGNRSCRGLHTVSAGDFSSVSQLLTECELCRVIGGASACTASLAIKVIERRDVQVRRHKADLANTFNAVRRAWLRHFHHFDIDLRDVFCEGFPIAEVFRQRAFLFCRWGSLL